MTSWWRSSARPSRSSNPRDAESRRPLPFSCEPLMQARPFLTALALVAGATAFAAPAGPTTTQRLKITATNHQVIDLSAFGQGEQVTHIVTSTFVTITAADSAGGRSVRMV